MTELAQLVADTVDAQPKAEPSYTYPDDMPLKEKIETVARRIYGAERVTFGPGVLKQLQSLTEEGCGGYPVRIAKTQYLPFLGQSQAAGSAQGFHPEHPRGAAVRGRGVHGGLCGETLLPCPGCPGSPLRRALMWTPRGRLPGCSKNH